MGRGGQDDAEEEAVTVKTVAVGDLVLDERCQARAEINTEAVEEYVEAYRSGKAIPAIEVYLVSGKLYVVDGYHRVPAAREAGATTIECRVVGDGTIDDAAWYATSVNDGHGVRRTRADKRRAVRMALQNPNSAKKSDRAIAEHCGVGHQLVGDVRREHEGVGQVDESSTSTPNPTKSHNSREGKDGKMYPASHDGEHPAEGGDVAGRCGAVRKRDAAIESLLREGVSHSEIAKKVGCTSVIVANTASRLGISVKELRRERLHGQILEMVEAGIGASDIARRLGCSTSTVFAAKRRAGVEPASTGPSMNDYIVSAGDHEAVWQAALDRHEGFWKHASPEEAKALAAGLSRLLRVVRKVADKAEGVSDGSTQEG